VALLDGQLFNRACMKEHMMVLAELDGMHSEVYEMSMEHVLYVWIVLWDLYSLCPQISLEISDQLELLVQG